MASDAEPPRIPCPSADLDTTAWTAVVTRRFSTILPPKFRTDTARLRCHHGGELWVAGESEFGYCNGKMVPIVQSSDRIEQVLDVAGRPALVWCERWRGRWHISAYHLGDSTTFGVSGETRNRDELAVFMRALRSTRAP